ncbi:MAG: uncharacterized protein A8A55_2706 [Amphiamblys sp. WSBS2006]|nr:MAG: uncharacterized protein A8A55_2706 [Amphiamblys sp. WSBS2006]
MKVFELKIDNFEYIAEILKTENNSIWIGKMKKMELSECSVEILPKLGFHEENEVEVFDFSELFPGYRKGIHKIRNNSIWVGKVKKTNLVVYAVEILPKSGFHEKTKWRCLFYGHFRQKKSPGYVKQRIAVS